MTAYHAFISYSHAADGPRARALQSGLQRLAKPWFRLPLVKVFRDETSLSANPGLWSELERNLERSQHLILLASTLAARSPWVEREVAWWIAHRSIDTLFIVVTSGTIRWDPAADDFDWSATTCLPERLKGRFREEPFYADLTWATGNDDLSLRHSQFRGVVLDLAAPLHGKPKDELDSEDIRQNRRLRTATWSALGTITVLGASAAVAAWLALQNANEATRNAITAISRQLAVEAQLSIREGALADAIRSALAALRTEDTSEARSAVFETLEAAWDVHGVLRLHQAPVRAVGFRKDARELLTWSEDNALVVWDTATRRPLREALRGTSLDVRSAAFNPQGNLLATGAAEGSIVLWDVDTMKPRATLPAPKIVSPAVNALAFDAQGMLLAAGYDFEGLMIVWDIQRSAPLPIRLQQSDRLGHDFGTDAVALSADRRYVAAANGNPSASVGVWELSTGKLVSMLSPSTSFWVNDRVAFVSNMDGDRSVTHLAIATSEGFIQIYREGPGENRFQYIGGSSQHEGRVTSIAAGSGLLATGGDDGLVSSWPAINQKGVVPAGWAKAGIQSLAFSAGGEYLAAGGGDGTVIIYYARLYRPRFLHDVGSAENVLSSRSPDGRWIARRTKQIDSNKEQVTVAGSKTGVVILGPWVGEVRFSPDSRWLLGMRDDTATLWDLSATTPSRQPALEYKAQSVSFSPSGRLLMTVSAGKDGGIRIWDLTRRPPVERLLQQGGPLIVRRFSPDEKVLLTTSGRTLQLWDAARGTPTGPPIALEPLSDDDDDDDRYVIEFSPDSRWFLAGRLEGSRSLYRVDQNGVPFPEKTLVAPRFSPDGRWLAASGQVWNLSTLTKPFDASSRMAWYFSADGRWLAGRTPDGQVELRELKVESPQQRLLPVRGVLYVEFSPDSRWLLTAEQNARSSTLTDVVTLTQRTLPFLMTEPHAFSPDGRMLAAAAVHDSPLALMDVADARVVGRLAGHSKRVTDLEYSPDGRLLASVDANGSAILWDAVRGRRLSETLVGQGEDEDLTSRLHFDADGMTLHVDGTAIPAHPWAWIESICRRTDPSIPESEWKRAAGTVDYPWTCSTIEGVTKEEVRSNTRREVQLRDVR